MSQNQNVKSVSEITNIIKNLLEHQIGLISVEGEISNFKPHYTGHRYFTLKDDNAQISGVMWKSRSVDFEMSDGQKVVVTGTISVYPPRGNYQMDVISIIPSGVGDLYKAFELLKQKLQDLNYFNPEIKKPLPEMPMNIGVSTSPTGAAVKDIFSTIKRRFGLVNIYFRPTIVQGDSAPEDIANAIKELSNTPSEVIIIGRGGGSIEDLWAYNTEQVADAIFNCSIPIISAVGHETDFSIADFVADVRAATPTAAAEFTTPQTYYDVLDLYNYYQQEMTQQINNEIENQYDILKIFDAKIINENLLNKVHYDFQWLDSKIDLLQRDIKYQINNFKGMVDNLENQCKTLSPSYPLLRGYALLMANNKIISNKDSLSKHKRFEIIRQNEKVVATFEKFVDEALF
jgi:exodeoxyribonuclease VII large subunit